MNTNVVGIIAFSLGAVAGSLITWKLVEAKYKRIADEEIKDVVEHFSNKKKEETENEDDPNITVIEKDSIVDEYSEIASGYKSDEEGSEEPMKDTKPFVIPPEEFGQMDDYEAESLMYFEGDGVLTDDWLNVIENVDGLVGKDFAEHFGEYEDDSVFVRNPMFKKDFEILKDERTFESVKNRPKNRPPHWVDDDE